MEIKRVYLINSPSYNQEDRLIREGRCMQRESSWANLWMPLSICILKRWLREELGLDTKVRDAVADRLTMEEVVEEIKSYDPQVVIINTAVPSILKEDLDMAEKAKKANPNIFTVMIGIPPTIMTEYIFNDSRGKYLDACIHHEAEEPSLELINNLMADKDWKKGKGISYWDGKKVVTTPAFPPIDLDRLPPVDYDDLNLEHYTLPFTREKVAMIETSRGCPGRCTFCIGKEYYSQKFRFRDPKMIADEIEELIEKYDIHNFLFWADTWMLGLEKAGELCDEIIKRGLKIGFLCNGRVDAAPLWLYKKMKKAGCLVVALGVESCDQEVLNRIKKGVTVEQIRQAIANANEAGVRVSAHVIVGMPGETWESVKRTTKRLIDFNPTYINVYNPVPYPGTELFKEAKQKEWIETNDFNLYEELHAVMRNDDMTTEDMHLARNYMVRKFYFRPRIVLREIFRGLKHPRAGRYLYNLFKDGIDFIHQWNYRGIPVSKGK